MRLLCGLSRQAAPKSRGSRCTAAQCMQWSAWESDLSNKRPSGRWGATADYTPTPHPALASHAEATEWQAVLQAKEELDAAAGPPPPAAAAVQERQERVWAVVELGSHATRLLLSAASRADVARLTRDTQLGEQQPAPAAGSTQQQLSPATKTLAALQEFRAVLDQHALAGMTAVATAAVREAGGNADAIAAAAAAILGCPLRVLSAEEEGVLAFKGVTASLAPAAAAAATRQPGAAADAAAPADAAAGSRCLVVDLGGRSTELAVGVPGCEPEQVVSLPLGCLSIKAGAAAAAAVGEPASEQQLLLQSCRSILDAHASQLANIVSAVAASADGQQQQQQQQQWTVLCTGGSITTLAALQQELPQYDHAAVHLSRLTAVDINYMLRQLCDPAFVERCLRRFAWLTPERAASLAAGCAGVLALMQRLGVAQLVVSDCDLLDGLLLEMLQADAGPTARSDDARPCTV